MGVPVATPVSMRDLAAGFASLLQQRGRIDELQKEIQVLCGRCPDALLSSGRAGLYLTLVAMKAMGTRDEVIIPAFVCPSVGRAVVKAGLKAVVCDVSLAGFGLDVQALLKVISGRTLAVVTTHLYGYPTDPGPIINLAHSAGAMVIEDAAQALGATIDSRSVGTFGDVGIFSFGMSKVLSTMGGGLVLVSNPRVAASLRALLERVQPRPRALQGTDLLKLALISTVVRSHHLGPLARFWAGALRGRHDGDDFKFCAYSPAQAAVASALLRRLQDITAARQRNAAYFAENLSGIRRIRLPEMQTNSQPVFLRFPIVVEDLSEKSLFLARLRSTGINASEMYDRVSYQLVRRFAADAHECPTTEYLIDRMINLPTHPYLRQSELEDAVAAFHGRVAF